MKENHLATIQLPLIDYPMVSVIVTEEPGKLIDVCAVLSFVGDVQLIRSRETGVTLRKRELTLIDESQTPVIVELWNDDINRVMRLDNPVTFFRNLRTKIYAGMISLSFCDISTFEYELNHPRTEPLKIWWRSRVEEV